MRIAWHADDMRKQLALVPLLSLSLASCTQPANTVSVDLSFEARVGSEAFACGQTYTNVGASRTSLTPMDLRLYVHDVRLVTASGAEHALALDGTDFQGNGVALLDFEDGTADCRDFGTAVTNHALTGTVTGVATSSAPLPAGTFTELRFRIGVPQAQNHLALESSRAPLNIDSMYWGWLGGYKYLRFEGRTTGQPMGFFFHLGATDCTGLPMRGEPRVCVNGNRPEVRIALPADFSPSTHRFVIDVARWMASVDLDRDQGGSPGCMAEADDPDCASYMATVGLPSASTQTLMTVERIAR